MDVYLYCFVFYFGGKFPLYYPPSSDISITASPIFYINGKFNSLKETFLTV